MAGRPRKVVSAEGASAPLVDAQPKTPEHLAVADLPTHHRENAAKLSGEPLRALAHHHGIAKSELATMNDEKIRDQMKYLAYRRASEDSE